MTQEASARSDQKKPENATDEELILHSRFGEVRIPKSQAIYFPHGLLGLKENIHFGITEIPGRNMGQFRLMQCLNDPTVSFIVLPLDIDNNLIERKDIEDVSRILNVELKNLLTLLIVTVKKTPEGTLVTANVRAPVVIDVNDKAGIQYVFSHNKYDIRTEIAKIA